MPIRVWGVARVWVWVCGCGCGRVGACVWVWVWGCGGGYIYIYIYSPLPLPPFSAGLLTPPPSLNNFTKMSLSLCLSLSLSLSIYIYKHILTHVAILTTCHSFNNDTAGHIPALGTGGCAAHLPSPVSADAGPTWYGLLIIPRRAGICRSK